MYYGEFNNAQILYQTRLYWLVVMPFDGIVLEIVGFSITFVILFSTFLAVHTLLLWKANGGFCRQKKIKKSKSTEDDSVNAQVVYEYDKIDDYQIV